MRPCRAVCIREVQKTLAQSAKLLLEDKIKQLTDQLAWYRCKFWKASSEKYIPQDPSQRRLDFDGLDVLPQEEEVAKEAAKEIVSYERRKAEKENQDRC